MVSRLLPTVTTRYLRNTAKPSSTLPASASESAPKLVSLLTCALARAENESDEDCEGRD